VWLSGRGWGGSGRWHRCLERGVGGLRVGHGRWRGFVERVCGEEGRWVEGGGERAAFVVEVSKLGILDSQEDEEATGYFF